MNQSTITNLCVSCSNSNCQRCNYDNIWV